MLSSPKLTWASKVEATTRLTDRVLKDAGQNYWNQAQLTNSNVFFFKPEKRVQATHQLQNRDKEEQQKSDEITCGIQ